MINLKTNYIYFLATIRSFFKNRNFLRYFGFIFGLYFIGFFKFLTSDVLHKDDIGRFLRSYSNFYRDNRNLSEFLSHILHTNSLKIIYISPITQLIAIVFLSLASLVLVKIANKKISYWGLVASLTVGLSPFYLECISFKFDSPYMALATLCAILPFLFVKRLFVFFVVSVVLLLCMWNLYQANNGIYIVLSMFITLNLILQKADLKQILKFIFVSASAFIISVLIYKFLIMPLIEISAYTKFVTQTIDSFDGLKISVSKFLYFLDLWIGPHIIKNLFFISCILFLAIKFLESKINYLVSIASILFFLFFGFFATFGLFYVFSNLNLEPRLFCGIGVLTAILLISITNIKIDFINSCVKIFIFIFAYNLVVISTIFINAAIIQAQYADFRINQAISYIENNFSDKNYNFQISGMNIGSRREGKRLAENNNIGLHKTVLDMVNHLPLIGNTAIYGVWFRDFHEHKNIKHVKCMPKDQKPIKTINTKLNKFNIYENNCIVVEYKKIPVEKFDLKFEKSMLKYKTPIFEANLQDNLSLLLSKDMRKADYGMYGLIFEFNQDLSKFADKDDTTLSLHIFVKGVGNIIIDKDLGDFKKIDDKFYYIAGLANAHPNDIEKINVSFWNKNTKKFSQRFLLDLKELNKK